MTILIFVFVFLLGIIIGSFLNVVIFRFNTGRTITKGRSICMTCNRNLRWYELVPLFSFLIQRGRCRRCASKISHQYPIVEFITGLVFVLIAFKFWPVIYVSYFSFIFLVLFFAFIFSVLIVISVYDLRHKIIPDQLVFIFIVASIISLFINHSGFGPLFTLPSATDLMAGPIFSIPFVLLWYFSKGKLMGLGDGKLVLGLGWLLGLSEGIFALIISFWVGTIISLLLMISPKNLSKRRNKINMKTEIPFAPFLIIGLLVTFLFNFNAFTLIRLFSF